nr:3-methyl-2-oxobutanoate hydroxymethyltransferase [Chryseomicrobium aureum]
MNTKGGKTVKSTTQFKAMKMKYEKITMVTAYDYPSAKVAEQAGIDMILVGDSLGMVVLGYDSTIPVTVDDMIHHGKAARRGAPDTFLVVDMPFGVCHLSTDQALRYAIEMMQKTGAEAVKIEGAGTMIPLIERLTAAGIPVVAHLGLTPQSAAVLGGFKVQGKTSSEALKILEDAKKTEQAGAFMLVVECIPHQLAKQLSEALTIPTIGIGAGKDVDGQVLVFHDLIGYGTHHIPKFVKQYATVFPTMQQALATYVDEVKSLTFPSEAHQFVMKEQETIALYGGKK